MEGTLLPRAQQPQLFQMLLSSQHGPQNSTSSTSEGLGTQMTPICSLPAVTHLLGLGGGVLGEVPDSVCL